MASQKRYLIIGILFSFIFVTRLVLFLMDDSVSIIELLNWGTLVYMAFAISYLYPQFKYGDERIEMIKKKGIYYSIFIVLVILITLMILLQFNILSLTSLEIVRVLISVIIITIWTSWIILSRRM